MAKGNSFYGCGDWDTDDSREYYGEKIEEEIRVWKDLEDWRKLEIEGESMSNRNRSSIIIET